MNNGKNIIKAFYLLLILGFIGGCVTQPESTPIPSSSPIPTPASTPVPTDSPKQSEASIAAWRGDLNVLITRMEEVHPNLYWRVAEEEVQTAVSHLNTQIPNLTDQEIIVELARIVSLFDGHTHLPLFQPNVDFQLYPIRLYQFSNGLFVVDADEAYADLIGSQVMVISNTAIEEAFTAVSPIVPRDNEMTVQLLTPVYLTIPELLLALEIIDDVQQPGYVLQKPDGETVTVDLSPTKADAYRDWTALFIQLAGLPAQPDSTFLRDRSENFWYMLLEDSQTIYIQYNLVQAQSSGLNLTNMLREVETAVNENEIEQVVLDIRHNPGGNINVATPIVTLFRDKAFLAQIDALYVITGRQTFSAATLLSVDLEQQTPAIFAGEPTGGSPNLYGDVAPVRLPNTNILVMVSAIYWERSEPDDDRAWIEPTISVPLTSTDFFSGEDPVLKAIVDID